MPGALDDAWRSLALASYSVRHVGVLRQPAHRRRFVQVLLDVGLRGLADAGLRAAAIGTLLIGLLVQNLHANPELTVRLVSLLLVREAAPLLSALLLLLRTGTIMSARLSAMRHDGETRALRLLGHSVRDYLAVPAVLAVGCATVVLTFYFELTAVAGGMVLGAVLLDLPAREMFSHLALALTPLDVVSVVLKSLGFGLLIASAAAYHGLERGGQGNVPEAVARSLMQSLFALLLFNVLFALLAYGIPAARDYAQA